MAREARGSSGLVEESSHPFNVPLGLPRGLAVAPQAASLSTDYGALL